jgi:transposase
MIKGKKFKRISISKLKLRDLEKYEKKVTSAKLLRRIQAIKLISMGWKYNKVADFLRVTNDTITAWIKLFLKSDLEGLLNLKYKGAKTKLSKEQIEVVREESKKGNFVFAKDVKKFIEKTFKIKYHVQHIPTLLKKNEIDLQKKQY